MGIDNRVKIIVAIIGAIAIILAAAIPYLISIDTAAKLVSEVKVDRYDEDNKTASGTLVLSKDKPMWVLVYVGKAGGPYWLQGVKGTRYAQTSKTDQGEKFVVSWSVSEVHIGDDVVEVYAIAVSEKDKESFISTGYPDADSGNAIKIDSLSQLPKSGVISNMYGLTP